MKVTDDAPCRLFERSTFRLSSGNYTVEVFKAMLADSWSSVLSNLEIAVKHDRRILSEDRRKRTI